jgi:hypothetical protein
MEHHVYLRVKNKHLEVFLSKLNANIDKEDINTAEETTIVWHRLSDKHGSDEIKAQLKNLKMPVAAYILLKVIYPKGSIS